MQQVIMRARREATSRAISQLQETSRAQMQNGIPEQPMIRVRVPATSANLGPGFDALGLALQLYNFISFIAPSSSDETGSLVRVEGTGSDTLPRDESNIAWQAARHLLRFVGREDTDFRIETTNAIPLSRGLGSSAAARVGALVAANEWARRQGDPAASTTELLALATQLEGHPDNAAAALLGGLVASALGDVSDEDAAKGRAGSIEVAKVVAARVRVERFPAFLVWVPAGELATKKARAVLPEMVSRADAVFNVSRAALLLAALASGELGLLREALRDRLHQSHRAALIPGYDDVVQAALEAGAYGATLSGAGSSILVWLPPSEQKISDEAQRAIQDITARQQIPGAILAPQVDLEGCVVLPDDATQAA